MKNILFFSALVAFAMASFGQKPDKALARVRYTFIHMDDTTQKEKPYTENMLLVIGKHASVYTSYDKIRKILAQEASVKNIKKGALGGKVNPVSQQSTSGADYYLFTDENKLFVKENLFNNYVVQEEPYQISWHISPDTASFSGLKCQKATAHFKGRDWIAWFAAELPFQSGPWKLNGLPGLIVDAYDSSKEVQFVFGGIEKLDEDEVKQQERNAVNYKLLGLDNSISYLGTEIKIPADAIFTSKAELNKLKMARAQDPQGFLKAQMAGYGGGEIWASGMPISSSGSPATAPKKKIVNNPIEIPEKP